MPGLRGCVLTTSPCPDSLVTDLAQGKIAAPFPPTSRQVWQEPPFGRVEEGDVVQSSVELRLMPPRSPEACPSRSTVKTTNA